MKITDGASARAAVKMPAEVLPVTLDFSQQQTPQLIVTTKFHELSALLRSDWA